jgi:hypothetical protein
LLVLLATDVDDVEAEEEEEEEEEEEFAVLVLAVAPFAFGWVLAELGEFLDRIFNEAARRIRLRKPSDSSLSCPEPAEREAGGGAGRPD